MHQHIFAVYLAISLLTIVVNGNLHSDKLEYDNLNLYELLQLRRSLSFTAEQRQFQKQMLDAHNTYRTRHCVPSLELDDQISHSAQQYAENLASANQFVHSDMPDLGENLSRMTSSKEIKSFDGQEIFFISFY
jgi:uncharacterized protein YkwD